MMWFNNADYVLLTNYKIQEYIFYLYDIFSSLFLFNLIEISYKK